jgi:hypothetical protein
MTPPLLSRACASGLTGAADAVGASSTRSASFLPLTARATADERQAWDRNLPAATALFDRLEAFFKEDHRKHQASIANPHAPPTPVNPRTLLKQGAGSGDLDGMQLHANWVDDGTLLMAVPLYGEAMAWARACLEHDVGAVATLGTEAEHDLLYPCMENEDPIRTNRRQVEFKGVNLVDQLVVQRGLSEEEAPQVALNMRGTAAAAFQSKYPETRAGFVRIDIGERAVEGVHTTLWADSKHELSNYAIPTPADEAIRPGLLLDFCRVLHDENSERPIAFQSPQGDDRAAVFAAAHGLYQRFIKGKVDAHNLESCILQQCINLRGERSATLFCRPDHLASLLTMGTMMLAQGRPKAAGTPVSMRTPEVVSAQRKAKAAPPLRSALKGARALALGTAGKRAQLHFDDGVPGGRSPDDLPGKRREVPRPSAAAVAAAKEEDEVPMRKNPGRR